MTAPMTAPFDLRSLMGEPGKSSSLEWIRRVYSTDVCVQCIWSLFRNSRCVP